MGISYIPNRFSFQDYNDLSFIVESRNYYKHHKILEKLKVSKNSMPKGPFWGAYMKYSLMQNELQSGNGFYLGLTGGRKMMSMLGKKKKVIEIFGGIGIGTPLLKSTNHKISGTGLDFRLGLSLGLHNSENNKKVPKIIH